MNTNYAAVSVWTQTTEWCEQNLKNVIRLFHRNANVDSFNANTIISDVQQIAEDHITGYNTAEQLVRARTQLHKMSCVELSGLPYLINVCFDKPYMLTTNIDVNDGLVNGVIGNLKFIEYAAPTNITHVTEQQNHEDNFPQQQQQPQHQSLPSQGHVRQQQNNEILCLWFQFPEEAIGKIARIKHRPHALSIFSNNLNNALSWTPIFKRSANISLQRPIKCKRLQFTVTAAAAITVHKSQGATFVQIVYDYSKCQSNQLVYVGLSRVTSIEGLYLTNSKNDFKFYHASGSSAPSIKEITDEYARLENHQLPTLTQSVQQFINHVLDDGSINILFAFINAQSFVAHSHDIITDFILTQCDYLMISETWMHINPTIIHLPMQSRIFNNNVDVLQELQFIKKIQL